MATFLIKTEPTDYNITQLEKDTECLWDGVENALALKHLSTMVKGDRCYIYHTGKEKQIVGLGEVSAAPVQGADKLWTVRLKFLKRYTTPLTLAAMKSDKNFSGFDLLRLPRLSVMPVPEPISKLISALVK
jgi:predicted RNA-binding protein with PUA-like domain